jgi:hypothetical protein
VIISHESLCLYLTSDNKSLVVASKVNPVNSLDIRSYNDLRFKHMAYVERSLDENTDVAIFANHDPAFDHPGAITTVDICVIRSVASFTIGNLKDYQFVLGHEQDGLYVNGGFPVFVANIVAGPTIIRRRYGGRRSAFLRASIGLAYCSNDPGAFEHDDTRLELYHTDAQHRRDVWDTATSLACFALKVTKYELPVWQSEELQTPLSDP